MALHSSALEGQKINKPNNEASSFCRPSQRLMRAVGNDAEEDGDSSSGRALWKLFVTPAFFITIIF